MPEEYASDIREIHSFYYTRLLYTNIVIDLFKNK